MSWSAILLLGALAYAFKAGGLLVLDHVKLPDSVATVTALLPPALLAALVVVQTFADGTTLVLGDRTPAPLALTFVKLYCDTYIAKSRPATGAACAAHARAAGLVAGITAVAVRAPFLVVVLSAAGVTAALRALV